MSASGFLPFLIFGLLIASALILFLPAPRSWKQRGASADRQPSGPVFRDDDQYWRAGVFYYNPDDPEPFVPKRFGLGWTVNFAHPVGKLILALMVAMTLLPIALALFDPGFSSSFGCHPPGCHPTP